MNKYDYLLHHFVSSDNLRTSMMQPNTNNEFTYATDTTAIIEIPKELTLRYSVKDTEKPYPNIAAVLPGENNANKILDINSLYKVVSEFRFYFEKEPCIACDGEGSYVCECCENDVECKKCDGTGLSKNNKANKLPTKDFEENKVFIDSVLFNISNIDRLAVTALITQTEKIKWTVESVSKINKFEFNDGIKVYIMPMMQNGNDECFKIKTI